MAEINPFQDQCCDPCEETLTVNIPGSTGAAGSDGADGSDGASAYTNVAAAFVIPAVNANVTVSVDTTAWMIPNGVVLVDTGGYYRIVSVNSINSVTLKNLGVGSGFLAPGGTVIIGSLVTSAGEPGSTGTTSGAAGGDLKGTYPNPLLSKANAKGTMIAGDGTDAQDFSVGADGTRPVADSAQAIGLKYAKVDLASVNEVTGTLPIANGGTGQAAANAGFAALSPMTTDGDIITRVGGVPVRVGIGTNGFLAQVSAGAVAWAALQRANFSGGDAAVVPVDYGLFQDATKVTDGGNYATPGLWVARDLDTEVIDTGGIFALSGANAVQVNATATYRYRYRTMMIGVDSCQARLFNVSGAAAVANSYSPALISDPDPSVAKPVMLEASGRVALISGNIIQVQVVGFAAFPTGLGAQNTTGGGGPNIYTVLELWREAA